MLLMSSIGFRRNNQTCTGVSILGFFSFEKGQHLSVRSMLPGLGHVAKRSCVVVRDESYHSI